MMDAARSTTRHCDGHLFRRTRARAPLIVGHRGAMAYAPENTLASFELAIAQGADLIELDVHLSRDGELVVIHDEALERTTSGHGQVLDRSLAELKRLDAGSWFDPRFAGQQIPTLNEVLAWAHGRARLAIEIKNAPHYYDGIEERVVRLLERHDMVEQSLVISFDHHALPRVRRLNSAIRTGVLYSARPIDQVMLARSAGADVLEPQWPFVTAEDVAIAHAAGLTVMTWTVPTDQVARLAALGVDGIVTNTPDEALRALNATSAC